MNTKVRDQILRRQRRNARRLRQAGGSDGLPVLDTGSVDFEMSKHDLAKELIYVTANRTLPPQVQSFKRALLLLVPGSSKVYQQIVEEKAEVTRAAR